MLDPLPPPEHPNNRPQLQHVGRSAALLRNVRQHVLLPGLRDKPAYIHIPLQALQEGDHPDHVRPAQLRAML